MSWCAEHDCPSNVCDEHVHGAAASAPRGSLPPAFFEFAEKQMAESLDPPVSAWRNDLMRRKIDKIVRRLMRHQDRYVKAWIAATGLRPEESALVQKHMPNGDIVMYVRKREEGER